MHERVDAATVKPEEHDLAASLENRIRLQMVGGEPLAEQERAFFEPRLGLGLERVRVHDDAGANANAQSLAARAFTVDQHIFFRAGEYRPESQGGRLLLAHELVHVAQQRGGADNGLVARKPAKPEKNREYAPEKLDLKGQTKLKLGQANEAYFESRKQAWVKVKFGELADGEVEVQRKKGKDKDDQDSYSLKKQSIKLTHPFFARIGEVAPELQPVLVLQTKDEELEGFVGLQLQLQEQLPSMNDLDDKLKTLPALFGLKGFDLGALQRFENKLEQGKLLVGLTGLAASLGTVLAGSLDLFLKDGIVEFKASVSVHASGLAEGKFDLERSAQTGLVTGAADVNLTLPRNITGTVHVGWDGRAFDGKGEVGYKGEKFSGKITLYVMDEDKAKQLDAEKKAANNPEAGKLQPPEQAPAAAKSQKKPKPPKYVVFGDGALDFAFTPWLTGTAQVIVDYKGDLTVIGEIKPQAEIELFAEKAWDKELFKIEARASYGLPVVGNIFVFANIGMSAFARLGPGKFYKIAVKGTYSTDPAKANDFSIEGTLNISAAAGLKLRAEGGAGLEILDHDLKAGVGVNGIAGIKGYVEATPIIGYREVAKEGEDKKGEFFLRGELEIAAQPFLGLSGDVFIEVDSPWWSPLPDDKWTWPLGSKEWPVGGSFGIGATTEYVFGSGKAPELSFHPVEFSGDKFMSDVYSDKTQNKGAEGKDKQGSWKEKNDKKAEPPPKKKEEPPPKPEKPKVKEAKAKDKANEKTKVKAKKSAEGQSIEELKRAGAKGRAKNAKKPKGAEAAPGKGDKKPEKANEANKDKAGIEVEDALDHGVRRSALLRMLAKLKNKNKLKSITLDERDDIVIVNSDPITVKGVRFGAEVGTYDTKKKEYKGKAIEGDGKKMRQSGVLTLNAPDQPTLRAVVKGVLPPSTVFPYETVPENAPRPESVVASIEDPLAFGNAAREGGKSEGRATVIVGRFGNLEEWLGAGIKQNPKDRWEGGHLFGHQFGGPDSFENLVPQRGNSVNRGLYKKIEDFTGKNIDKVKKGSSSLEITYKVAYGEQKQINVIETQRRIAELTTGVKGRELAHDPKFVNASIRTLSFSYTTFNKIKGDKAKLATELAKDGVKIDPSSRLAAHLDVWRLTDPVAQKIYQIDRDKQSLRIYEVESAEYFGAKHAKPTETDATKTLSFVPRLPKSYNVELKFTGIKSLTKDLGAAANKGGQVDAPDYVIIREGGKATTKLSHKDAMKEAAATPDDKLDKLSIVVSFNLTPT